MVVGAVDLATGGTISGAQAALDSWASSSGSLQERVEEAAAASNRARLNVVSLGFSEAVDKGEHLQELVGINAIERAGTLYGEAIAEGSWEKGLEATGELLAGTGQVAGTVAIAAAPAAKAGWIPKPRSLVVIEESLATGGPRSRLPSDPPGTWRDKNNRLHDGATGRFVREPSPRVRDQKTGETLHRNSRAYEGESHVYAIRRPDGSVFKVGKSSQGTRVDGASLRAEQQVRELNETLGPGHTSEIRRTFETAADALDYEAALRERFRKLFGEDMLPGNRERTKGKARRNGN